jgi:hypothetical protein
MSFFESIIEREKRKVEHLQHHVREMIARERLTLPLEQVAQLPHVLDHIRKIARLKYEIKEMEDEMYFINMVKDVTTSVPRLRSEASAFVPGVVEQPPRKKSKRSKGKRRGSKK